MSVLGIIPARYGSTRFPGKPLADIGGKSMLQRVWEAAIHGEGINRLVVATDDTRILSHVHRFGGEAVMTGDHASGTDRCWEAYQLAEGQEDYVINIQGDEPLLNPLQITELASLCQGAAQLVTQISAVKTLAELQDPGEVKVVLNADGDALYFSRSPIPFLKGVPMEQWPGLHTYYRHVGMYAYRSDVLEKITQLPVSALELAEGLEQLRWLEGGYKIRCGFTKFESYCVDTPEDLSRITALLAG